MAAAGNRTGILSSFADLFSDEEPDMKGKLVVFDPAVFNRTGNMLRDWSSNRSQWKNVFGDWNRQFDSDTKDVTENVHRENDYLKYLRDGGFENTLAGIRSRERENDQREKQNALDYASGAADRAKFATGAGIGGSSADFARRLRAGSRIEADFGGRDTARERGDLAWVNQTKLGIMGRINANIEALNNRKLTPQQLSDRELATMVQTLAGIQGVRMGSASPVFWREKDDAEKVGDVLDTLADSAYKGAEAYSTFGGMGGGGGMGGMGGMGGGMGGGGSGEAPESSGGGNFSFGTPQGANEGTGEGGPMFNYSAPTYRSPSFDNSPYYPGSVNPYGNGYRPSWDDQEFS